MGRFSEIGNYIFYIKSSLYLCYRVFLFNIQYLTIKTLISPYSLTYKRKANKATIAVNKILISILPALTVLALVVAFWT